ncbi:hypothetical protein PoB_006354700 [Plakobranchus ocellatus]|uniref:Uncharacterized protein n=1 Tax=Plakobranchus ocellatus TaxID=259542 RepID=A0AAV4CYM1_9GAST|nr:hypothetical protein PoB_006354700 [Plakobranchus ocellatus]
MQTPAYGYNTTASGSGQISNEGATDQGSWQQPVAAQNADQNYQEGAYFTGIITGQPQSYYTKTNASGYMAGTASSTITMASAAASFPRGAKTSMVKSPKTVPSNVSMGQNQGAPQYGNATSQYMVPNQFQDNTMGDMSVNSGDAGYYGYPCDQLNNSAMVVNDSYSTMGMVNNNGGMAVDNSGMNMAVNNRNFNVINSTDMNSMGPMNNGDIGMNNGSMAMSSNGNMNLSNSGNMSMGVNGNVNMSMGSGNVGMNVSENMDVCFRSMNMGKTGHGMDMNSDGNIDHGNNNMASQMGTCWRSPSNNSVGDFRNNYSHSDHVTRSSKSDSYFGKFRGRGGRFQPMGPVRGRGSFNNSWTNSQGWRTNSGFRNNAASDFNRRGRGIGWKGRETNFLDDRRNIRDPEFNMGLRNYNRASDELTISLNATNHNNWCYLRKNFGKRDNDLVEHLFEIHNKHCAECKERNGAKKPYCKRKVSEEPDDTAPEPCEPEELTEEELQMKELMGFAGFKTSKGSKPKDLTYGAVNCAGSSTKLPKEAKDRKVETSSALTPEERKAMAALGGFSVFTKTDSVEQAPIGFGAPAVTFSAPDDSWQDPLDGSN